MSTNRLLHLLGGSAASPVPADRGAPRHRHRLCFPQAGAGMLRASVACSSTSTGGRYILGDNDCFVFGIDDVRTKLELAIETGIHDTIGIDLTAEMPGYYAEGEFDLSGSALGVVNKDKVIDGRNIVEGDIIIGLPSSGLHSNGLSLARRVFPSGLGAKIITGSWEVPPVLKWLQQAGNIDDAEMRRTFNMGIGMVLVVSRESADRIIQETHGSNPAYRIGEVIQGEGVHYA
ncbi:unnamed protein product [Urochloa decumbens]|uniref:phosphoribosylformylglycinamidine cyclo-ligase n=1 Tax=Urochloa decumbens TaxID=240449 RepID=A0ABC9A2W8_9POAL